MLALPTARALGRGGPSGRKPPTRHPPPVGRNFRPLARSRPRGSPTGRHLGPCPARARPAPGPGGTPARSALPVARRLNWRPWPVARGRGARRGGAACACPGDARRRGRVAVDPNLVVQAPAFRRKVATESLAGEGMARKLPLAALGRSGPRHQGAGVKGFTTSIPQLSKSTTFRVATAKWLVRAIAAICPSGTLIGSPSSFRSPISSP